MEELDLEKLEKRINDVLFPHIEYRRKTDSDTLEEYYEASVNLSQIERLFNEDEYDYIFRYLGKRNIIVGGSSPALYNDYKNYRFRSSYRKAELSDAMNEEQIKAMLKEYQDEDDPIKKQEIRNELVVKNLRLVKYIAQGYSTSTGIDVMDLCGYGCEGLIKAIEKYDFSLEKGTFASYAGQYIKGYILTGIPSYCDFYDKNFYYELSDTKKKIEEIYGKKHMCYSDISDDMLEMLLEEKDCSLVSDKTFIDKFLYNVPEHLSDYLDDKEIVDKYNFCDESLEDLFKSQLSCALNRAIEILPEEEQRLLDQLFGLSGQEPKALRTVAFDYSVSHESIRQRRKKILNELSHNDELNSYRNLTLSNENYDMSTISYKVKKK